MNFSFFADSSRVDRNLRSKDKTETTDSGGFNSPFWKQVLLVRWLRVLIAFLIFLIFLLLWSYVNYQFTILLLTVLPLFIGYAFSYFLQPVNVFFQRFFSEKTSRILVFILFLILTLALVLGLFFIFFIQLDSLYKKFLYQTQGLDEFLRFLDTTEVKNLQFVRTGNETFEISYDVLIGDESVSENVAGITGDESVSKDATINTENVAPSKAISSPFKSKRATINTEDVAGIFVLLLHIAVNFQFLQGICFSFMVWLDQNVTNYGYLQTLWNNWQGIALILYLLFFTIIIAAFSLGKGSSFFDKVWFFFTKDYEPTVAEKLKLELKKNLSSWGRGLLIVELYIMVGTGFFLFTAGIIFSDWSSYVESSIVLTLFMTLCNLVPYIGPTIGFIPIVSIGLIDVVNHGVDSFVSWIPFIIAVVGCFSVQIGESAFVSPLVYSYKVNLSPTTIIVGLAVTGVVLGVFWMPLTIPAILVFKIFYQVFQKGSEKKSNIKGGSPTLNHTRF